MKYKLINENRGEEIIQLLYDYTNSLLSDVFSMPNELNLVGDNYDSLEEELMDVYENNLANVEQCNSHQSISQLNSFLTDDVLSVNEALFCILGLNIALIPYNFSILSLNNSKNSQALNSVISNTNEYRKLTKSIIAKKHTGLALVENRYINTEQFISWAQSKGFIELIDYQPNPGNISKYNKDRALIKDHNDQVIREEFEKWQAPPGKSKNANLFANNATAYNNLKPKLKPLTTSNTNGTPKTLSKTQIANCIRNQPHIKKFNLRKT